MSRVRCSKCNKNKQRISFSKNQLKKPKPKRSCKSCIKKQNNKLARNDAPKKQNNNVPKQQNNHGDTYIESLKKAASILEEPGQLSFLQKLHQHCVGKLLFTEMHLAYEINPKQPLVAQAGLQRIFSYWPDIFVYRNILIIACNNKYEHVGITAAIKNTSIGFKDWKTRFCLKELLYEHATISTKGIQFYDKRHNLQNVDLFTLLSKPITDADEKEREFRESFAGKAFTDSKNQTTKLTRLQQNQISIKLKMNTLKREMVEKQNRIKTIVDNNILVKWNLIKNFLKKQKDVLFDTQHLDEFRDLLDSFLTINWEIQERDGYNNDILLRFDEKTTIISSNTKNNEFLIQLEDIISYFIQQIENKWQLKQAINDNDDQSDVMVKLVNTLKIDIVNHEESMKHTEREFNRHSMEIAIILQNMVNELEKGLKQKDELWNVQLYPTKLIFDLRGKHEPLFLVNVLQKKEIIVEWISQRIHKYEGISEYGADHLFCRFLNFIMFSNITWWIAVLRWLSLPITIVNLNLLREYVRRSVDEHFMPNSEQFGTEIDVMMVVTYFMHATKKRYESNPLKYVYNVGKKDKLLMLYNGREYSWEKESEIIKLCHDCFGFVVELMPKYKQTTTALRMNKQIDIYMSNVQTHIATRSGDNSYRCIPSNDYFLI